MIPAAIADYAAWRAQLLPIIERTEQRNQHPFAKQVDEALLTGRAALFLVEEGFVVLEPNIVANTLEVWVLFAYSAEKGAMARHLPTVEALAQQVRATRLRFYTAVNKLRAPLCALGFTCIESGDIQTWIKDIVWVEKKTTK
ncbi:hypothetical protein [Vibrio misgurnus]|uniref:hypothetical protein n=1 Tax=Vibrio misgurnus TaxID=2993714 RepID=UPI0023F8FE0C|nr:hypothetical protein [Vibrio sp. VCS]